MKATLLSVLLLFVLSGCQKECECPCTPTPIPVPQPTPGESKLTAVWANTGEVKIPKEITGEQKPNPVWADGKVTLVAAKNETVGFNLMLEAKTNPVGAVSVGLPGLTGAGEIKNSVAVAGDGVFDWNGRPIEIFVTNYLPIKGLSGLSYEVYDERHIPEKFRRPHNENGIGTGKWRDRPHHDKSYPEILVPHELKPTFTVAGSQAVWVDIFVAKGSAAGKYTGNVEVFEGGTVTHRIPLELVVEDVTLPDATSTKTAVYMGYGDLNQRYFGNRWPNANDPVTPNVHLLRDRHFQMARRHRLSMIDKDEAPEVWTQDAPRPRWQQRLSGAIYTPEKGYKGPGEGMGHDIYSIGTYGSWSWPRTKEAMVARASAWEQWFKTNAPGVERFLYLVDESSNYTQTEGWAKWVAESGLATFATLPLPSANQNVPSLTIAASWFSVAPTSWEQQLEQWRGKGKRFWVYNGKRPASGSFATEDEGTSVRMLPWVQKKKGIDRWFFWESTYYNNFQGGTGQTDVWTQAKTFGGSNGSNDIRGETGWNYSNGDGVLFYPGTDTIFAQNSLSVLGPIPSLRLKLWRRGLQDMEYYELARAKDATAARAIIEGMVPSVLWENGVTDPNDPTWVRKPISWSTDPGAWYAARQQLLAIIKK